MPVYWTNVKKTKANTTHLTSMSWYRNAFYHAQNALKKDIGAIVRQSLVAANMKPLTGQYGVIYTYYYKTKTSDLLNVGALSSKIFNDVLQEEGYVVNDNVQFCMDEHFKVGIQDRDDPRMEIKIYEIKKDTSVKSNKDKA